MTLGAAKDEHFSCFQISCQLGLRGSCGEQTSWISWFGWSAGKTKGQLVSKGLFGILNSSKKQTKFFDLTTMIPQAVDLFSFVFWKNFKTPKRLFKIN